VLISNAKYFSTTDPVYQKYYTKMHLYPAFPDVKIENEPPVEPEKDIENIPFRSCCGK
jgi:hypothetical protein